LTKNLLLAATSVIALVGFGVPAVSAAGHHRMPTTSVLYSQNGDVVGDIVSTNFTSGFGDSFFNSAAADDFVIPAGQIWHVTGIDVSGEYINTGNPASSEIVTFYRNSRGRPGRIKHSYTLTCTDNSGSFSCPLPTTLKLRGGATGRTYWLSVVANCPTNQCEWHWDRIGTVQGNEDMWEDPNGGISSMCEAWHKLSDCFAFAPSDLIFDIVGF